jgi:hypothetical protein
MQIAPLIARACSQIGEVYESLDALGDRPPTPAEIRQITSMAQEAERTADQAQVAAAYVMSMFKNGPDAQITKRLKTSLKQSDRTG